MYKLCRLTTPKIPATVMLMDMFIGFAKVSTGRSSLLENKCFASSSNRAAGVGLVQLKAATKPEIKKRTSKENVQLC